jgi:hypothetical protein
MRIENFLHNCKQRTNQHISNDTKSTGTNKESSKPDVRSPDRREYRYVQLELQVREVTKAPKLSCVSPTRNCLIHHATTFLCFPLFFFSFICFFGKLQFGSFLVDMNTGTTLSDGSTDLQSSAPIDPCLSLIQSIYGVPACRSSVPVANGTCCPDPPVWHTGWLQYIPPIGNDPNHYLLV